MCDLYHSSWSPTIGLGIIRLSAHTNLSTPSVYHMRSLAVDLGLGLCRVSAFTHSCVCDKMSDSPCVQHLALSQCTTKPFLALLSITFFFSQARRNLVMRFTCKFPYCGVQYLTQSRSRFRQTSTSCRIAPSIPTANCLMLPISIGTTTPTTKSLSLLLLLRIL